MRFLSSWLRVALIDLGFDLRKFAVLLACLALGVGTIAAIGSVGSALNDAIARQARTVLGGDLEATLGYRPADAAERALFARLGRVSEVIEITSRASAGAKSALIALRAVDGAYPLAGTLDVEPAPGAAAPLPALLAPQDGIDGAVADPLLFDRLGVHPGDIVAIGSGHYRLVGTIAHLPDQAARGFALGTTVLVATPSLARTGLLQPGVLARYRYKIDLAGHSYEAAATAIKKTFPDVGWQIRSPREAAAGLTHYLDLFERFLVLVGLSSLLVGGIGVSNATAAYIGARERSIATLRSLGATSRRVLVHFLAQILLLGLVGSLVGLGLGAAATLVVLPVLGGYLGIELPTAFYPGPLLIAMGYGLLIAFVFAYPPLLRATRLPPALLFRAGGGLGLARLPLRIWLGPAAVPMLIGLGVLTGLALLTAGDRQLVLWYGIGAIGAVVVLRLAAALLGHLVRRLPWMPTLPLRLALRNLHRIGAPTATVTLSLGLGLMLMLTIALVEASLTAQLSGDVATSAPSFVLLNVDKPAVAALQDFARTDRRVKSLEFVPYLRGIVTRLDGTPVADIKTLDAAAQRRLGGDQALSWRADLPPGDAVLSGKWWPEDYAGPPLVSLDADFARPLHLKVGDGMEIAISGRPVAVKIANIRHVDWQNASLSFSILFSPGLISGAPQTAFGALKTVPGEDGAVESALVHRFPGLAFIPVKAALDEIAAIVGALAHAVTLVGAVALLSGVFVLAGALAAGRRRREADAVIAKVLGATRGQIAMAFVIEYGLLGFISALVAAALATAAGWAVSENLLQLHFVFDGPLVAGVAVAAMAVTILAGLATTWATLARRPAVFLRAEE